MKDAFVKPFVKWVGGKHQLLPEIRQRIRDAGYYTAYYEPFLGGGAVLFDLMPKKAIVNDFNSDLINTYVVIKNNVDDLIDVLKKYKNTEKEFYHIRSLDREKEYANFSDIEKAARLIYLNKTCYNGLYRVNSQGFFNSPFGHYKNPNIVNEVVLRHVSKYLNENQIIFKSEDFEDTLKEIKKNSLVYFDPPYATDSDTANFTGYTVGGFSDKDQQRLAETCVQLDKKGVKFIVSNSNVALINDLYKNFNVSVVLAKRSVNSNAKKRGDVEEVLITNY